MKRSRRTFACEYKLAAVKKVIEQGLSGQAQFDFSNLLRPDTPNATIHSE